MAIVTPAISGPFDLGTVVVRVALNVDPMTAQINAVSDPIPNVFGGVKLDIRSIDVNVNRHNFMINPTNCAAGAVAGTINGGGSNPGLASAWSSYAVSAAYQATGCGKLAFKPSFNARITGGTTRGDYQSLRAVVKTKEGGDSGEANIASAAVTLPHSAFLANEHIRTVCTRVQYAAGAGNGASCPPGSVYGRARAVTPLLDDPLEGPVYLRSSTHPLPDVVVALHGIIDIELSGQTDSVNEGIRNTFASVPDAPATKFVLELFGGKKALIVNSRNLCQGPKQKATAHFVGQNGKVSDFRPVVQNSCKKAKKSKKNRSR